MYHIMIVEGDPVDLAVMRAILQSKYEVTQGRSGHQTLETLKSGITPDIFLIDMTLPDIKGIDLVKTIRENEKYKKIPVIFILESGIGGIEIRNHYESADDCLVKPVAPFLLEFRIKQQINIMELKQKSEG